jgi:uncharacterized protein YnzC (UPF0291/DUF896 family)
MISDPPMLSGILDEILRRSKERNLSQAELARRASLSPEALSRLRRSLKCEFDTVARLASVVGLDICATPRDSYRRRLEQGLI